MTIRSSFFSFVFFALSLFLFLCGMMPVLAATCAISSDTVINQNYVTSNTCTAINIQGNVSTTWIGTVDLGGGVVTVKTGYTMTMGSSSQMVLGAADDFVIETNATTTHLLEDLNGIKITARNITVNGDLSATEKGCRRAGPSGDDGYGVNTSTGLCVYRTGGYGHGGGGSGAGGGGGAYGGVGGGGGSSAAGGSVTYGDSLIPNFFGSSGGTGYYSTAFGGAGGGIIYVTSTGTLTVNGRVIAQGGIGRNTDTVYRGGGGGAGGSIYIKAGVLAGIGIISADGGSGGNPQGGGGGGGRVALYYGSASFPLSSVTAARGSSGTAGSGAGVTNAVNGTTYILNRVIDDGAGTLTITSGHDFNSAGDYTRDVIAVSSGAYLSCATASALTVSSTAFLSLSNVTWSCTQPITSVVIASNSGLSTTSTSISFTAATSLSVIAPVWTNVTTTLTHSQNGAYATFDIGSDLTLRDFTYTGGSAGQVSAQGGILSLPQAYGLSMVSSTLYTSVSSSYLTALSIDSRSSINASSKGCPGSLTTENGYGPNTSTGICTVSTSGYGRAGNGAGGGGGGAAHAGTGGASSGGGAAQTTTYGSSTYPILFGSGGGGGYWQAPAAGGKGGGRVFLIVSGTVTNAGSIKADGGTGLYGGSYNAGGGGSGGSVYLRVGTLAGNGSITAAGGSSQSTGGGGGGGGRIYLAYSSLSFSGTSSTSGGTGGTGAGSGSAGTIGILQLNTAPSTPSSLGPTSLVNGSTTGTGTPTFSFTLSDPDVGDTVKYRIQIDDSSDFSSPIVDYTSALAAQGSQTFRVGQGAGSGSYTIGSSGQTLVSGSYYWRVKTIDAAAAESSYTTANSGAVAFILDTATRTISFQRSNDVGLESVTATSVKIILDQVHFETVMVDYSVSSTSSTAEGSGVDFSLASGTATIAAGQTSTTISLTIVNDLVSEPNETIVVTLSNPVNASLGSSSYTYVIQNDDTEGVTITESGGSSAVTEGGSADSFNVVLLTPPTSTVLIILSTSTDDLLLSTSTLYFNNSNWNIPQTVTLSARNDEIYQGTRVTTITPSVSSTAYGYDAVTLSPVSVTVTDNDAAGFTVSSVSGSANEGGGSATYTVVLTSQPTSTVTIALSGDTSEISYTPATLSFTSSNWNTPQTVTVSALNDSIAEPDYATNITHAITSSGITAYTSEMSISSASINVIDNDVAGVTVSKTTAAAEEGGGGDSWTYVLTSRPTSTVQLTFTTSTNGVTVRPSVMTFSAANWDTPQTLTMNATNDHVYEGTHTTSVQPVLTSTAYGYRSLTVDAVYVTITDDDVPGVAVVVSTSTIILTEGGVSESWTYVLTSQPTSTVQLVFTTSTNEVTLSHSELNFTDENWNIPQSLTVFATNDQVYEGTQEAMVQPVIHSTAYGYRTYLVDEVDVTLVDNDVPGVIVSTSSASVTEGGSTVDWTYVLTSEPTSTVQLMFATSTLGVTLSADSLSFNSSNWDTPQTLTVQATDDAVYEGAHTTTVHPVVSSGSLGYTSALSVPAVTVSITDDDTLGIRVSTSTAAVTEGGSSTSWTYVLTSQPTSTVQLLFTTSTYGVTLSSSVLTFTSSNWATPQTLTMEATDDSVYEGSHSTSVQPTVVAAAYGYSSLIVDAVDVTIADNDVAGVTVSPVTGSATEGGSSASYTLVLTSQPTSTVSIQLSADEDRVSLSTSTVHFTSSNWNIPVSVRVSARENAIDEPNSTTFVRHVIDSIGSLGYTTDTSIDEANIDLIDNDEAGVTVYQSGGSTAVTEGGSTDTFTVVLDTQPTSTVEVLFATSTNGLTLSTSSLVFHASNWSTPQTVTVRATDDALYESTHTTSVAPMLRTSAYGYSSLDISPFPVTITDNDISDITLSESTIAVREGGTGSYTIALTSEPTSTVQVLVNAGSGLAVSPSTLTFTSLNYHIPQTVHVSALNDAIYTGNRTSSITQTPSSTGDFVNVSIPSLSVSILDDEVQGGGGFAGGAGTGGTIGTTIPTWLDAPSSHSTTLPSIPPRSPGTSPSNADPSSNSQTVTTLNPSDVLSLVEATNGSRDFAQEARQQTLLRQDAQEFRIPMNEEQSVVLANFVTYGISRRTRALGSGERRALIRDALETMGTSDISPADLERLVRGQIPQTRNLVRERQQLPRVRQTFRTIYGHDPNFQNAEENLAWNTLMYRIRFERDLKAERQGIDAFRQTFNRDPRDPFQWAVVRAMGYVQR